IEPSDVRMLQFSADVVAILTIIAATLPSLIATPCMFFSVRMHESVALPIHRRAELLLKIASLKCAPIENLARIFHKGFDNAVKRTGYPECTTKIDSTPNWLTFLNPVLFPRGKSSLRYVGDNAAVYLTMLTVASRPQPQFPLIIRAKKLYEIFAANEPDDNSGDREEEEKEEDIDNPQPGTLE
ncbi:hypothetical protein SK128_019470, partial [Halocaridina rubra]